MSHAHLIEDYLAGPKLLREAVAGLSDEELDAKPIPGKWSTRQIICHLADFEPVYADRMKRVIAEDNPPLRGGDPEVFAAKLAYEARDIQEELNLIEAVRRHTGRILKTLPDEAFQRTGMHSADGPLTLETLLQRITEHIPHHIRFIEEKKQALQVES
jgi:uncharacterized damage-inducible protein DinB